MAHQGVEGEGGHHQGVGPPGERGGAGGAGVHLGIPPGPSGPHLLLVDGIEDSWRHHGPQGLPGLGHPQATPLQEGHPGPVEGGGALVLAPGVGLQHRHGGLASSPQQVEHLQGGVPWQVLVHLGVPEGWQGEHQLLQHPPHQGHPGGLPATSSHLRRMLARYQSASAQ